MEFKYKPKLIQVINEESFQFTLTRQEALYLKALIGQSNEHEREEAVHEYSIASSLMREKVKNFNVAAVCDSIIKNIYYPITEELES